MHLEARGAHNAKRHVVGSRLLQRCAAHELNVRLKRESTFERVGDEPVTVEDDAAAGYNDRQGRVHSGTSEQFVKPVLVWRIACNERGLRRDSAGPRRRTDAQVLACRPLGTDRNRMVRVSLVAFEIVGANDRRLERTTLTVEALRFCPMFSSSDASSVEHRGHSDNGTQEGKNKHKGRARYQSDDDRPHQRCDYGNERKRDARRAARKDRGRWQTVHPASRPRAARVHRLDKAERASVRS